MSRSPRRLLLTADKAALPLSAELIPQVQLRDLHVKEAVLASDSKEFGCLARITAFICTIPSSSNLPKRNKIKSDRANRFVKQGRRFARPQVLALLGPRQITVFAHGNLKGQFPQK